MLKTPFHLMAHDNAQDPLDYHLSKLKTYPSREEDPVSAGGAADAEVVLDSLDEFETELQKVGSEETYDFEIIRHALETLVAYYDPEHSTDLTDKEAYIFSHFVSGRMEELQQLV